MKGEKKRAPSPVIIPKKISDWIKQEAPIVQVNNFKKGGGRPGYNSTKQF